MIEASEFTLPEALFKTIAHFAPGFWTALTEVKDPRNPFCIAYPLHQELLVAVLMSMVKVDSRRNIKYKLGTPVFVANMLTILKRLYPKGVFAETMFHGDTLNYALKGVDPREIRGLCTLVIRSLLRKRCFDDFRLKGLYHPVAVDGTGALVFRDKHCDHCLRKTSNGQTVYYHPVVEAKLVLRNGLALSVGTEFPENEHPDVKKQDCELKAFYRLAKTLKKDFPQTRLCLLLDGLFACAPVVNLCERNRWAYIITLKEGSLPAVCRDYEALLTLTPENVRVVERNGCRQTYRWINDVDFGDRTANVFECLAEERGLRTGARLLGKQRGDEELLSAHADRAHLQPVDGEGEFAAGAHSGDHGQPEGVLATVVGRTDGDRDRRGEASDHPWDSHPDPVRNGMSDGVRAQSAESPVAQYRSAHECSPAVRRSAAALGCSTNFAAGFARAIPRGRK